MPAVKPTPAQLKYLRHLYAQEEQFGTPYWQSALAIWRAAHPEGTTMSANALVWRVNKTAKELKSQGWVEEKHLEHRIEEDAVNVRKVEEALYRITERGKRVVVEAGAAPVVTRRVRINMNMPDEPAGDVRETIVLAEGLGDGRVVTLPVGQHDQLIFTAGGRDVRYRRSRRPHLDGHAVFVPAEPVAAVSFA